jgi:hypothetical protein
VSFLIGIAVHLLLGMPDWITAAIMFNNTTSYSLLLVQSLDETGILSDLIVTDETTHDAIEQAKSYFLVFATISSCLTFAVGPRLIDMEHAPNPLDDKGELDDEDNKDEETEARGRANANAKPSPTEQTHLFSSPLRRALVVLVSFFPSRPRESSSTAIIYDRHPLGISKQR